MTDKEKSRMLNHLYSRLSMTRIDLDVWIQSVINALENIYGKNSKELVVFITMASEYDLSKKKFTGYARNALSSNFRVKSKEYLWSLIKKLDPKTYPDTVSDENKYAQARRTHSIKATTEPVRRDMNEIKTKTLIMLSEYNDRIMTMDFSDTNNLLGIYNNLQAYLGADSEPAKFLIRMIQEYEKGEYTEAQTRSRISQFLETTIKRIDSNLYTPTKLGESYYHDKRKYVQDEIRSNNDHPTIHKQQSRMSKLKESFRTITTEAWGIILVIVGGAFGLGMVIGQTKFDKEKIEMYEEVKILKKDTTDSHSHIRYLQRALYENNKKLVELQLEKITPGKNPG